EDAHPAPYARIEGQPRQDVIDGLRRRRRFGATLRPPMKLSAIIPTHNRPDVLRDCLQTLQAQQVDPAALEVIVADDGAPVDFGAVVAGVAERGAITMRCERLELTGLNGGRNRGAAVATGDVLAFLDDDTLVSPGWAAALLRAFEDNPCAAVGGRIE